jgi:hypothetical protein
MRDENKTKQQLINELKGFRQRVAELEAEGKWEGEGFNRKRGHPAESVSERTARTEELQEEIILREKTEGEISRLARAVELSPTQTETSSTSIQNSFNSPDIPTKSRLDRIQESCSPGSSLPSYMRICGKPSPMGKSGVGSSSTRRRTEIYTGRTPQSHP